MIHSKLPPRLQASRHHGPESCILLSFSLERLAPLSRAEVEVAHLASIGNSNEAIARRRGVSLRTVANQMACLLRKLAIGSRTQLAMIPEIVTFTLAPAPADIRDVLHDGVELPNDEAYRVWRELATGQRRVLAVTDAEGKRYVALAPHAEGLRKDWSWLCPRARRVLELVSDGMAMKAIGLSLGLAPAAVSATLRRARQQLGFHSLAALVTAHSALTAAA